MDFELHFKGNQNIKILQITDMQVIDGHQRRYPERLTGWTLTEWVPENDEKNIYAHIRCLVDKTSPDLIIITGDIIYGEFDDSGRSFEKFVQFMDSLAIPWAPVFGNHDNESDKGVQWQCEQFENAKYALFARGNIYGNGNYTIGIFRDEKLERTIYMLDSNGCGERGIEPGFREDQLAWAEEHAKAIHREHGDVKAFMCFHIPTDDFLEAYIHAGYQSEYDVCENKFAKFIIGQDTPARNGDFGEKNEAIYACCRQKILPLLKVCKVDGVFVGHCHRINTSVLYEDIRFTFGYKTGYYDYHDENANGGTLITLEKDQKFRVEHVKYE